MLSLIFTDAAGNESHYIRDIYDLAWSLTSKGGPLALTAALPMDLLSPKLHLLDGVSLYDGLDEIWLGRVRELPAVTRNRQAGVVVAEGYFKHLSDDLVPKTLYNHTAVSEWKERTADFRCPDMRPQQGVACLEIVISAGTVIGAASVNGTVLEIPACSSVRVTGTGLRSGPDVNLYACHGTTGGGVGGEEWAWTKFASGGDILVEHVGDNSAAFDASVSGGTYNAVMLATDTTDGFTAGADTAIRFSDIHVYCTGVADLVTTTVLKHMLAAKCPKLSTDVSKITAGTYTLPHFVAEGRPAAELERLNAYEGYDWGVYDRDASGVPRLTFGPHDNGTVHYVTSLRHCRPDLSGASIESQYNAADVGYADVNGRAQSVTRTATHALLDAAGITRKPDKQSADTTSAAAANQVGDTLLADSARPQGKGGLTITGYVWDNFGRRIPAHRILPDRNILIADLMPSPETLTTIASANVLNGVNCFHIVNVDAKPGQATVQLDNEGDRLDFLLARR